MGGKHWNTEGKALGRLEPDLDASAQPELTVMGTEACIAPGFQETPGEGFGRTCPYGEGVAEPAAAEVSSSGVLGGFPGVGGFRRPLPWRVSRCRHHACNARRTKREMSP